MIIGEKVKDLVVVGEDTSKKAKISQNKLAKLQYLLTKGLYKDPITAVIAEWTNNGIDSVVQAGKNPVENPVLVKIEKGTGGQYVLRVEDKGTGLDDRDFEDICMNYLESTKEEDNDTIGHFGIGMKSFLSLERAATFTCVKSGIERKYIVYEGAEFVNYDLIHEKETTEENGVIAELAISNWNERWQFVEKAKAKLAYYDTAVLIIDGSVQSNDIYRNELFQWSTAISTDKLHLCLKDVYYPIDWDALGIKPIEVPVGLRLSLSDGVTPTPSRESYITNEETKRVLMIKIRQVADWFLNRYNETVRNFKSLLDAYEYLGQMNLYVVVEDNSFKINDLLRYTDIRPSSVKVDGITIKDPLEYKSKKHDLLKSYSISGYINHSGTLKTKEGSWGISIERHVFEQGNRTVLVDSNFRGNIKEYLKYKYGRGTMFLRENGYVRPLIKPTEYTASGQLKFDNESLKAILGLSTKAKNVWRKHVEEWNFVISTIVATFKDERKVEDDSEYQDWLKDKKDKQRELRKLGATKGGGLGKQEGDVTLAYSYSRYGKIFFGKKVYPIRELHKNKFLTVLVTDDDDIELARDIIGHMLTKDKVRFAHVGKKEIKKIPDHFQFINFQRFMSRNCKPFMRLASAIKFDELLEQYRQITNFRDPIFKKMMKGLNEDARKLQDYVTRNLKSVGAEVKNTIIDAADLNDLYDKELWGEFTKLKKEVEKFDFLALITPPSSYNQELQERYNRLVNQMLLFRKKYYDELKNAKIVFEPETKTKTDELV